jgi:outer membrane protein TolC
MKPRHKNLLRHSIVRQKLYAVVAVLTGFLALAAFAQPSGPPPRPPPNAPGSSAPVMPPPPDTRRPVTLKQALLLAAEQSPDIAIARAQAAFAQAEVSRAWTPWKPDLSATGTFDRTSAPASFDSGQFVSLIGRVYGLAPVDPSVIPPPTTIVGRNSHFGNVQLIQPLFSPQGILLIAPANRAAEGAQLSAQEAREQVLLGVARAYLSVEGVEGLMNAARDLEQVSLRREKDAKAQLDVGMVVETALLRAQAETNVARAQIADLEGQRETFLATMEALVGQHVEPDLSAPLDVRAIPAADPSTSPWDQTYLVRSSAKQVEAAQGSLRYDHYAWLPTLSAGARGNYTSNGGFAGVQTSYDLFLTLTVPLYDRGLRYTAMREDEARLAQAQATLESNRAKARANWLSARANVESSKAVLAQADAQAVLNRRVQKQVEASYQAGVATNLELSDADQRAFLAASAAAQARANLAIRYAELAAAEGRLYQTVEGG